MELLLPLIPMKDRERERGRERKRGRETERDLDTWVGWLHPNGRYPWGKLGLSGLNYWPIISAWENELLQRTRDNTEHTGETQGNSVGSSARSGTAAAAQAPVQLRLRLRREAEAAFDGSRCLSCNARACLYNADRPTEVSGRMQERPCLRAPAETSESVSWCRTAEEGACEREQLCDCKRASERQWGSETRRRADPRETAIEAVSLSLMAGTDLSAMKTFINSGYPVLYPGL